MHIYGKEFAHWVRAEVSKFKNHAYVFSPTLGIIFSLRQWLPHTKLEAQFTESKWYKKVCKKITIG